MHTRDTAENNSALLQNFVLISAILRLSAPNPSRHQSAFEMLSDFWRKIGKIVLREYCSEARIH